jgi:uncharacterized protein YgbK (DUF1537 family)
VILGVIADDFTGATDVASTLVRAGLRTVQVIGVPQGHAPQADAVAVVQALGVTTLRIGAAICPGVPWTQAEGRPLLLALKSGNFGGPDFFDEALRANEAAR